MLSKFLQKLGLFLTFTTSCFSMEDDEKDSLLKHFNPQIIQKNINSYLTTDDIEFLKTHTERNSHIFKELKMVRGADGLHACLIRSIFTYHIFERIKHDKASEEEKHYFYMVVLTTRKMNNYTKRSIFNEYKRNNIITASMDNRFRRTIGEITIDTIKGYSKDALCKNEKDENDIVKFNYSIKPEFQIKLIPNEFRGKFAIFITPENKQDKELFGAEFFNVENRSFYKEENPRGLFLSLKLSVGPTVVGVPYSKDESALSIFEKIVKFYSSEEPMKHANEKAGLYADLVTSYIVEAKYLNETISKVEKTGTAPNYYPAEFLTGKKHKEEQKKPFKDRTVEEQKKYLENKLDLKQILDLYDKSNENNHSEKIKSLNNQLKKDIKESKNVQISPKTKHLICLYLYNLYGEKNDN